MNASRRVLYVVSSRAVGGAEMMALRSAVRLRDRHGLDLGFVAGGPPFSDRLRAAGFAVDDLPLRDNADALGLARLWLRLRRTRPALVHLHMNRAGLLGGVACGALGLPCLVTAAGMVHRRYVDRADLILACSEGVRDHLLAQGVPASSIRLLRNAIEPRGGTGVGRSGGSVTLQPGSGGGAPASNPRGSIDVLMVARLHPNKGQRDLLRAFALLAPDHPGARLAFAGGGPRDYEAGLRALARSLGIASRVRFLGERDDVPALLDRATLFALPSSSEGLPLTVLEAMDAGLPCVAYDIPGLRGIASFESGGPLLVPLHDVGRLAGAIGALLRSPPLRRRIGAAARATVARDFSLARYGDDLATLYAEKFNIK